MRIKIFPLFNSNYVYGQILLRLYKHPDERRTLQAIKEEVDSDPLYLETAIKWLVKDDLIEKEFDTMLQTDLYRISHKGFTFIRQLKDSKRSHLATWVAIVISIAALAISIWAARREPEGISVQVKKEINNNPAIDERRIPDTIKVCTPKKTIKKKCKPKP